jgi:UDP-glucose 4-epimerase
MTVLIVGGAGYIGSHMVWQLHDQGKKVVVLDDLSSGHTQSLPSKVPFVQGSMQDRVLLDRVFSDYDIKAVMHFAAFIEVGESMIDPAKYYENNVVATLSLLNAMRANEVKYFVLSSTAAVFGEPQYTPIDVEHPKNPLNTYGHTKLMVEQILADYDRAYGLKSVCLRYFNACGADPHGRTGESHDPESHLIPLILQVANGRRDVIKIFGDDYDTPDGSCVRDYVHVNDLCSAHGLALQAMMADEQSKTYNLGNGQGFSVKQVIQAALEVTKTPIAVELAERRVGDPATLVADSSLIQKELGWEPKFANLHDIIAHAWAWEKKCY